MAESFIQLAPDSTGKKAHSFDRTIGANTVHDEVVQLGEQYLASYVVASSASIATANSHIFQIMAGASLRVYVRRIVLWQDILATTATLMGWQVLRLTTAGTGGTALTPNPQDPADAASGATCRSLPSAQGTEGVPLARGGLAITQTLSATPTMLSPLLDLNFDQMRVKPIIIAAGTSNGICLKSTTAVAAANVSFTVWFSEANF